MVARLLIALAFAFGFTTSSWAYYANLLPPYGWSPPSDKFEGYASIKISGSFASGQGRGGSGGLSAHFEPQRALTIMWNQGVVEGQFADSGVLAPFSDPLLNFLWSVSPGAEAHAALPLLAGAGVVVRAVLPTAGRLVSVPAYLRFASNAPRFASKQVFDPKTQQLLNLAKSWILASGLSWVWDDLDKRWKKPGEGDMSDGYEYRKSGSSIGWELSKSAACNAWFSFIDGGGGYYYKFSSVDANGKCYGKTKSGLYSPWPESDNFSFNLEKRSSGSCPVGWYVTPAGCIQTLPMQDVPEQEFEDGLSPHPDKMPDELPEHLPDGLPVESPKINPLPTPWSPSQPYFDPVGDPVPNPNYDPNIDPSPDNAPRIQPGRKIDPSPTTQEQWRVEVQPVYRPIVEPGPVADPNPEPDPTKNPENDPDPSPDPNKPRPQTDVPLLCEVFPNISACQPLGNAPAPQPLNDRQVPVTASPAGGFGPSEGTCPSPVSIAVMGSPFEISWEPICEVVSSVRPVVIALAWFTVALTMFGFARKGD